MNTKKPIKNQQTNNNPWTGVALIILVIIGGIMAAFKGGSPTFLIPGVTKLSGPGDPIELINENDDKNKSLDQQENDKYHFDPTEIVFPEIKPSGDILTPVILPTITPKPIITAQPTPLPTKTLSR